MIKTVCSVSLLLILILSNVAVSAAGVDTLRFFDFQDQQLPTGWQNLDLDSASPQGNRPAAWYPQFDPVTTIGQDSNWTMAATSWFSPADTADNWLVLDTFTVCDSSTYLFWKSAPFEGPVYMDGYEVLLSTTDSLPGSFTINLGKFAEGIGNTATPSSGTEHDDFRSIGGVTRGVLQEWRVGLQAYVGQRVFIAFHHTSEDDNLLMLDDILFAQVPEFDVACIRSDYGARYTQYPESQGRTLLLAAELHNRGSMPLSTVDLEVRFDMNGTAQYLDGVNANAIDPDGKTVLNLGNPFVPTAIGAYDGYFAMSLPDTTDERPENDTCFVSFAITDSVLARDDGQLTSNFSFGPGRSGIIGYYFDVFASDTVTSISFFLDNPIIGDTIRAGIYSFSPFSDSAVVSLEPYVVTGASQWVTMPIPGGGKILSSRGWYVGLEESNSGSLGLGMTSKTYDGGDFNYVYENGSWDQLANTPLYGTFMLRVNFGRAGSFVSRPEPVGDLGVKLFPNPFDEIVYWESEQLIDRVEVYDVAGELVWQTENVLGIPELDTQRLPAGTYFFKLFSGQNSQTYLQVKH